MNLSTKHILSTSQFDKATLLELFEEAGKMEKVLEDASNGKQSNLLAGKIMAALFYEPSTRTRFSFEVAMQRLGGTVVSNADMMATSSAKKSETLEDTGKVVSKMVDVIVMRHPDEGSVKKLAGKSDVPVINAGDGRAEHPTQALLDLYTIWKHFKKLDGLKIGLMGDLLYGRVPHSQVDLLKHFENMIYLVSPNDLKMPRKLVDDLSKSGSEVVETGNISDVIGYLDVIGMTRVQRERFPDEETYERNSRYFVLDKGLMHKAKSDCIVIHPLPRVNEISLEVDSDPRAKYFEQVGNGVAVRMALLKMIFSK